MYIICIYDGKSFIVYAGSKGGRGS